MTEHLPSPENNSPESPTVRSIDRLTDPTWNHFVDAVHDTEHIVSQYDPRDLSTHHIIDQRAGILSKEFGWTYDDQTCQITGFARRGAEEDGISSNGEKFINTDQAIFRGVDILSLEGRWRAILAIELTKGIDGAPSGMYYFQPDARHIAELRFIAEDKANDLTDHEIMADLRTRLAEHVELSRAIVTSPEFAERHPAGQRVILLAAAARLVGEIMREYNGAIVDINCTDYYVAYDNEPTLNPLDTYTDVALLPENDEESTLAGVIEGFGYPELDTLPMDQPITLATLRLNHGAACMIVYSEKLQRRYYIPAQSIISVI